MCQRNRDFSTISQHTGCIQLKPTCKLHQGFRSQSQLVFSANSKKLYDHLDPFEQVYRPAVFFWRNFTSWKPPQKKASVTHTKDVFGGKKWPKVARSRGIGFGNHSHSISSSMLPRYHKIPKFLNFLSDL